ncbi:MAG: ABC transporter permease [Saccharofermentanales bacterium]
MKYKVFLILIILALAATLISPHFLTGENLINVIRQITVAGIVGIGFTIVISSGYIDLSVGSILGLTGALTAMFSKIPGMPIGVTILFALLLGTVFGLINAALINILKVPAFIATLSTMSIFRGPVYIITNMNPVTDIHPALTFIGQGYIGPIPFPIIIFLIIILIGYILLNRTTFGRHALAIGGNPAAARASGVSLVKTTYLVYIIMGAFTAIAALVMTGRANSAQTAAGQGMELDAVAAVVIGGTSLAGGTGNIIGTVIGCLLVGIINNILNLTNVNTNYQLIVKGLLIIIAIALDVQSGKIRERLLKRRRNL